MGNLSIKYIFAQGFIITSFFPWVSFHTNSMDTQPWAFLCGCGFIFLFNHQRINKNLLLIFLLPVFILFVSVFYINGEAFLIIRVILSYCFLAVIFFAFFLYFVQYGIPFQCIIIINLIYIFFGLWQLFIGDSLVNIIVPIRTTEDRGVTSLAIEPTNFGMILLIFSWLYLIYSDYNPSKSIKVLISINIFSIFILAQSSMTILFIFLAIAFVILYRISFFYLIIVVAAVFLGSTAVMEYLPDARVSRILSLISNLGISELVYEDLSINARVSSVIFPYEGLIENAFLPGGATSFQAVAQILKKAHNGYFWYGSHTKIMSYMGSFVYQLGFIGVLACLCYFIIIQNGHLRRFFESAFLFLLLNSALPLASPVIAILLCSFILIKKQGKRERFR